MKRISVLIVASLFGLSSLAHAEPSHRMEKQWGVHADLLGDPFFGYVGANLNYNLLDFMRLNVGYNYFTVSTTDPNTSATLTGTLHSVGGGIKFLVPTWNFTPTVGMGVFGNFASGTLEFAGNSIGSNLGNLLTLTFGFGFDWQTGAGFNLGAGARFPWDPANNLWSLLTSSLPLIPHIYLGWYF
jgi:hypothetical protein